MEDGFIWSRNSLTFLAVNSVVNQYNFYAKYKNQELEYRDRFRKSFKKGDLISGPEATLYNIIDHQIYYYPINIDIADKVIFRYNSQEIGNKKFSSINYGQQDDKLDLCIIERMKKYGFNFNSPAFVDSWAIVGRN